MSDQDDLFATNEPVVDPTHDYLTDLVGEDRKYKTPQELAKAAVHKDQFIDQLKRETAELREALNKRINEEEFLRKLEQVSRPKSPDQQDPPVERRDEPAKASLTVEDVDRIIAEREAAARANANLKQVEERLRQVFGDDYRARVQSQAKSMEVGTDFLTDVAKKNPQAFYRLMGLDGNTQKADAFSPPPRPSMSTPSGTQSGKKDYNYYKKLRDEKGDSWYFSIPVQQEIWKTAKEYEARGEKFIPD